MKSNKKKPTKSKKIIKKPNPVSSRSTSFSVDSAREGASCTAECLGTQQFPTQGEKNNFFSSRNSVACVSAFSPSQEHPLLMTPLPEKKFISFPEFERKFAPETQKYIEINNPQTFSTLLHVVELMHDKTDTQLNKTEG